MAAIANRRPVAQRACTRAGGDLVVLASAEAGMVVGNTAWRAGLSMAVAHGNFNWHSRDGMAERDSGPWVAAGTPCCEQWAHGGE
ncbi:hypothetical protein M0R45_025936 [Rubus argutus]|uniref:Uncharacterized protein n=1 Tax=Rubus argutus TaxID=59490 RepID=A0AAW1WW03_RUBAR